MGTRKSFMTLSYKAEPHLHMHVTHRQRNTHSTPKTRLIGPGERSIPEQPIPWTNPAKNRPHHSRISPLAELRTRVFREGWKVIQFRFSEDFTVAVHYSVFGRGMGFVAREGEGKGNCSRQIRLDTDSAMPHNKYVLLTHHRRADIPLTTPRNLL